MLLGLLLMFCSGFCCCARIFIPHVYDDKELKSMSMILTILFAITAIGCFNL